MIEGVGDLQHFTDYISITKSALFKVRLNFVLSVQFKTNYICVDSWYQYTKSIIPAEILFVFYKQNKQFQKWTLLRTRAPNKAHLVPIRFLTKTLRSSRSNACNQG